MQPGQKSFQNKGSKMDYSYIFHSGKLKKDTLKDAGFISDDNVHFFLKVPVSNNDFTALFSLSADEEKLSVELFDNATEERYALFDMWNNRGAFVNSLREEVQKIIENLTASCFESESLHKSFISYLKSHFSVEPDFPWPDTPEACVLRCPNNKWFALIMKIKYRQIGILSDEEVFVVNLKAEENKIQELINHKSIFPAWHMNKKHWITILLTSVTDFSTLCELTEKSYALVFNKKTGK